MTIHITRVFPDNIQPVLYGIVFSSGPVEHLNTTTTTHINRQQQKCFNKVESDVFSF